MKKKIIIMSLIFKVLDYATLIMSLCYVVVVYMIIYQCHNYF